MNLGILISGGGTTFLNLHDLIEKGQLGARITRVISSASKAKGLSRAHELGYPALFMGRRKFADDTAYSQAIMDDFREHDVELIICAGFLKKFDPSGEYINRTLNIHPSLIPAFCGHGYYGMKVHEAVWQRGCRVSGCTVHLVNNEYDAGPIIVQEIVALEDTDTPEDIRRKVFEKECIAYPKAIRYFLEGRVKVDGSRAFIK